MDATFDAFTAIFKAVDVPLVAGIVVLLEVVKSQFGKFLTGPRLLLLLMLAGFGAAFLKVNVTTAGWKPLVVQGIIYSAAANLAYQGWKTFKVAAVAAAKGIAKERKP